MYTQTLINTEIEIRIKNVYGNNNIYIVSQEHEKAVSILTGRKTINNSDMKALEMLGFTFKQVL